MGGVQQSPGGGRAGRAGSRGTTDVGRLAFVALGLAMTVACVAGDSASSRSGVVLVVERISAPGPGTAGGTNRTFVESDVVTGGVVIQDTALATLRLVAKDPGAATNPAAPSGVQFAAIDRYRVRYVRSDGRDAPGIDVPHPWEGVLTLTTSFDGRTGEFVLVPASAKIEPPLVALREGGGEGVIDALAYVTFSGRDHAGARIEAVGAITVQFADWSDTGAASR